MSLKTLSIGALARAMASTAVIGAVSFGAGMAMAATPSPTAVSALKLTIQSTITQTISDTMAANPNASEDEVAEAVAAAVANVTRNVDPELAVAALDAVRADGVFMASLPSAVARNAVNTAVAAVRTTTQQSMNTGDTTGDIGGTGDGGGSDFGGSSGGSGSGGGGGGGANHPQ